MQIRLILHFLELRINTHSQKLASWIEKYFQSYDQMRLFPEKVMSIELSVEEMGSPFAHPISLPENHQDTRLNLLHCRATVSGTALYTERQDQFLHQSEIDLHEKRIRLNLGGLFLEHSEYFIYHVMRDILRKLLFPVCGIVGVHSAILIKDGVTVCLTGEAGRGKSTTAMQLLKSGWRILSDDLPLVVSHNGQAIALSSLDCLSLAETSLQLFPELRNYVSGSRLLSHKSLIPLSSLPEGSFAQGPCAITHLIELRRNQRTLNISLRDKREVMLESIQSFMCLLSPLPGPLDKMAKDADASTFETIHHMVRQASTCLLEFCDSDLPLLAETIESITN